MPAFFRDLPLPGRRGKPAEQSFFHLLQIASVSWSLLSRGEKIRFAVRAIVRILLNGLDLVAVGLMGLLGAITATGLSGQNLEIFGFQVPAPNSTNVVYLIAIIAFLFVLKGGLAIIFSRWTAIFLASVEIKNSAKITRYLFSGSLQRLRRYSRSEVNFLVSVSTSATFSGVLGAMTTLVIEGVLLLSIFTVFIAVDWLAAILISAYFAALIMVLQASTAKRYLNSGKAIERSSIDGGNSILEMVDGFREIAVLSKQDFFLTRFVEAQKLASRTGVTLQILKSVPRYVAESGLILGALGFITWQLSRGSLAEGLLALGIFLSGSFRMMGAILPLTQIWNNLRVSQKWVTSAQEILVKLQDEPELLDSNIYSRVQTSAKEARRAPGPGLAVEISEVCFTHVDADEETLRSVSLTAPAGSYVAIVGPSGAGKTTLVDLLLGLYRPYSGRVLIDGTEPEQLRAEKPGLMAYVPQRPGLVSGSIAENVALGVGSSEWDESMIWHALETAQLADHVRRLPLGIHSDLGNHSDAMSGGQIQRLGLARALYTAPRLVILDEATSALDASTEASITRSLQALGNETTVIVIAHRLSTIQHADTVYVMDGGKILDFGTFPEIRRRVPLVEEYVKLMSFDSE